MRENDLSMCMFFSHHLIDFLSVSLSHLVYFAMVGYIDPSYCAKSHIEAMERTLGLVLRTSGAVCLLPVSAFRLLHMSKCQTCDGWKCDL